MIFPRGSTILLNNSTIFHFAFEENIPNFSHLKCDFGNGMRTNISNTSMLKYLSCTTMLTNQNNLSLWYSDGLQNFQISTNNILLYHLEQQMISFTSFSTIIGFYFENNYPVVNFNTLKVPLIYRNRLNCSINGTNQYLESILDNQLGCRINSSNEGIFDLSLIFKIPNSYELSGRNGVFSEKISINMSFFNLSTSQSVMIKFATNHLVASNLISSDCSDLVINFKNLSINRTIFNCNSKDTTVQFKVQQNATGNSNDYSIYFGNVFAMETNSSITENLNENVVFTFTEDAKNLFQISSSLKYTLISKIDTTHLFPFIDTFNENSTFKNKTITLHSKENIFTDYGMHCKIYFGNVLSTSKALKSSSKTLNCNLTAENLSQNQHNIQIELFIIDQNSNFRVSLNNLTYLFVKGNFLKN
jgi:hypothetical protein